MCIRDRHSTVTVSVDEAVQAAKTIRTRTGRPVFLTAQEEGIYVVDTDVVRVPAVKVEGEIDPVGAGDSCTVSYTHLDVYKRQVQPPKAWRII